MSALFNEELLTDEIFDSNAYIRLLCNTTYIQLYSCVNAQFLKGWKGIVDELINSIKNYPIRITRVDDTYSILDVRFEMEDSAEEVKVWRAIEKARIDSAKTCANCGEEMGIRRRYHPLEMLCDHCKSSLEKEGKTQTWLDKY